MSTDLKSPAPASPQSQEPDKPKIDLSVAQVAGGALAAMTAAFLGSRLSVAGTVVGAALASIVAAVAGNVYTASLRTTHDKVRMVFQGKVAGSDMPASVAEVSSDAPAAAVAPAPPVGPRTGGRLSVRSMVLGALAAFALAAAVLTGLELATGQALSGGDGTTITQVTEERASTPTRDPSPAATADSASPTPTPTASDSPEPSASETASSAPTPVPAPSSSAASPSPSASDTGTPTPSAEPTASANSSAAAG